jgi:hypothetical protein
MDVEATMDEAIRRLEDIIEVLRESAATCEPSCTSRSGREALALLRAALYSLELARSQR